MSETEVVMWYNSLVPFVSVLVMVILKHYGKVLGLVYDALYF